MLAGTVLSIGLFIALLAALELGRWIRRRQVASDDGSSDWSSADGVVFAVLGLLIAFTFTSAAARFDERRKLIIEQANTLGTAWLRTDLLNAADRDAVRRSMREWVKLSLDASTTSGSRDQAWLDQRLLDGQRLQNQTWRLAIDAVESRVKPQYAALVLSPINDWIDQSTLRVEMNHRGIPPLVMPTLIVLSVAGGILAGFSMARRPKRSILHMLSFAGVIALSIYVIIDLNHPRSGLVRVDPADNAMRQLYQSMEDGIDASSTLPAPP